MATCRQCGQEVEQEDLYVVNGQDLCEDCAMDRQQVPKPCDVWAVKIATNTRKQMGLQGTEGLSERQKSIYNFLKEKNGATLEELSQNLALNPADIRKDLAVLRHCELAKGRKRGATVYYVTWDYEEE